VIAVTVYRSADDREHRSPGRVREVYDTIAEHFSKTRANPWPEVEAFLDGGPAGRCGLDVGCGNGRHLELVAERTDRAVGVDASPALLAEARDRLPAGRNVSLIVGDAAALPVAADTVDVGLYVATLHHLPDRGARRASLDELARVLAPGGRALVSVWSTAHDRFDAPADADRGFDTTVDWTLPDGETVPRFYHIYTLPEFDADLAASALATEESFVSSGNCYARVRGQRRDEPRRCQ
jgi:ubiquinone/menaquinone biosynthesis C-methylase UbiE